MQAGKHAGRGMCAQAEKTTAEHAQFWISSGTERRGMRMSWVYAVGAVSRGAVGG